MESAELLDLLGNENRRRILQLLSRKPCYVTEIGEYLDVSPKAVIDHLEKLEDAGLVESRTDGSRRKYFHIARDVRLEVTVSRHEYGTKSAYAANPSMDILGRCAHVRLDLDGLLEEAADGGSGDRDGGGDRVVDEDRDETGSRRGTGDRSGDRGPSRGTHLETGESPDRDGRLRGDATTSTETSDPVESTGDGARTTADRPTDGSSERAERVDGGRTTVEGTGDEGRAAVGGAGGGDRQSRDGPTETGSGGADGGLAALAGEYRRLREMENELSLAQRWVRGRVADVLDRVQAATGTDSDAQFHAEVLAAVVGTDGSERAVVTEVDGPPGETRRCLRRLAESGLLEHDDGVWRVADDGAR